jgi:hypothetical protein
MNQGDIERFFSKVSSEPDENGCLIWLTGRFESGYGQFWLKGKNVKAHRIAWEIEHDPIPDGLLVLHKCDVKWCVNVQHLYLGTMQDRKAYGERHGNTGLTEDRVREIHKLAWSGVTARKIGEMFRASESTVYRIKYGQAWKHLWQEEAPALPTPSPTKPLTRRSF